ncbi:MAG: PEP-CTERM sorting domain-containing protein [Planctomycetota bacterium]|jgi:hypothetical protein
MKKLIARLVVGCMCAALLAWAQPAAAVVYDFDSLSGGHINGQDNWTAGDMHISATPDGGAPAPCDGNLLTTWGGTAEYIANRNNDGNWSFDLSGQTKFVLENTMVMDYQVSGYFGHGYYKIENTVTGRSIGFGVGVEVWYYDPKIIDAYGSVLGDGGHPRPTARNQIWDWRLEVDTTANGGGGGASFYLMQRGTHTTWQLERSNVNLQLVGAGADIQNANRLTAVIDTRIVAMDSLMVSIPSGPLTVKAFLDKNLDGTYNGSDEMLTSFDMTVSGPCSCGSLGESPWDRTTDGSGEFALSEARAGASAWGLDDGDYAITDRELYYDVAAASGSAALAPGGGAVTTWYGARLILGDANGDGLCDTQDFTILKAKLGTDPGYWADANFNADTITDTQDFTILKDSLGSSHSDYVPPGGAVPEPATMCLLALGGLSLLRRRRR